MANQSGRGTYSITVEPYELKNLLSLLSSFDKETQSMIRDKAQTMSQRLAGQLMMSGLSAKAPQTKLVVSSITTPRDRLIRVDVGGSKKVGRPYGGRPSKSGKGKKVGLTSAPAGALLWGTEFGSHAGVDFIGRRYTDRFKTPYNKSGHWIAPAVDYYIPVVAREYAQMIQAVANDLGFK
jgi:hypothetical protein